MKLPRTHFLFSRCFVMCASCLFIGLLSGCANFWIQDGEFSESETRLTTRGVGAATGAVLGAGLGAIVGNQSADAPQGLVLGGRAGAVAGGLIGGELEKVDLELAKQQEALTRREETVQTQGRELEVLRGATSDTELDPIKKPPAFNRPSASRRDQLSSNYQGNPRAKPWKVAQYEAAVETKNSVKRSYAPAKSAKPRLFTAEDKTAETTAPIITPAPTESEDDTLAMLMESDSGKLPKASGPVFVPKKNELAVDDKAVPTESATIDHAENATAGLLVEDDSNCGKAKFEAQRARSSTSQADQLFYLRRALRLCPTDAGYHVEIGRVYAKIGRLEDAEFEFRQAIDLEPGNSLAKEELEKLKQNGNKSQV